MIQKVLLSVAIFISFIAQSQEIDSLKNALETARRDEKCKLLRDIAFNYVFVNADSAKEYGNRALNLARELNDSVEMANAYNDLSIPYIYQGQMAEAIPFLNKAMELELLLNREERLAAVYNKLSIVYNKIGNYPLALEFNLKCLEIYEVKDMRYELYKTYNNLGALYYDLDNLENALLYYENAKKLALELKDYEGYASILTTEGNVYYDLKKFAKVEELNKNALQILDTLSTNGYYKIFAHYGLGNALQKQGKFRESLRAFNRSLALNDSIENGSFKYSIINDIANVLIDLNQLEKADSVLNSVKDDADLFDNITQRINLKKTTSKLLAKYGRAEDAYYLYDEVFRLRDSVMGADINQRIAQMQVIYETEKKEAEVARLNEQNALAALSISRQRNFIYLIIGATLLIIIAFIFILKQRKQAAEIKQQEQELALKNEMIAKTVIAQDDERKRIAKELHDGVAQSLAALKLKVEFNNLKLEKEGNLLSAEAKQVSETLGEIQHEVRTISHSMIPLKLQDNGLQAALEELISNTFNTEKYSVKLVFKAELIPSHIEITLYRVCQELFANILKHSEATMVEIMVSQGSECIELSVQDNGVGMKNTLSFGIGLANIQSRVEAVKGTVKWMKSPLGGVKTIVLI